MGKNKHISKMTRFVYLLIVAIFFSLLSCNGQQTDSNTSLKMGTETFDISSYEKKRDEQLEKDMLNPWTVESTLTTGEKQELYSSTNGENMAYFKSITPPEPALLKKVKKFHANGKIAVDYETYVGLLNPYPNAEYTLVGKTTYYDDNGNLVKIEDNEKTFHNKTNLNKLLSFLENEPILDSISEKDKQELQALFFSNKKIDEVTPDLLVKFFETKFNNQLKERGIKYNHKLNGNFLNKYDRYDRSSLEISYKNQKWIVKKDFYPFGWVMLEFDTETEKVMNKKYHFEDRP